MRAAFNRATGGNVDERDRDAGAMSDAVKETPMAVNPETGLVDHSAFHVNPDAVVDTFEAAFKKAAAANK